MKNTIIGFLIAITLIVLVSGKNINDFLTVKPATPNKVAIVIDNNLWNAREKAFNFVKSGYIIKDVQNFRDANSPYYHVLIVLEKY